MEFSAATNVFDSSSNQQQLSVSDVKLHHLTHLADYLPDIPTQTNPLDQNPFFHPISGFYLSSTVVILRHILFDLSGTFSYPPPYSAYHRAGPRKHTYFDPSDVRAAIVTCGGLCPGLNTVIRELVMGLWELYGVRQIYGIKAGYRGFYSYEPVSLNPKMVRDLHKRGGTILETSRGGFDLHKIVDSIQNHENEFSRTAFIVNRSWQSPSFRLELFKTKGATTAVCTKIQS